MGTSNVFLFQLIIVICFYNFLYQRMAHYVLVGKITKGNVFNNMEKGLIEVAPLAYMRGRTLDNAFIILDEAQNTTPAQMKMFL